VTSLLFPVEVVRASVDSVTDWLLAT